MSYSVSVGGLVCFPSTMEAARWLESEFAEDADDDWGGLFGRDGHGQWIVKEFLRNDLGSSDNFLRFRFEGRVVRVAAMFPEDLVNDRLRSIGALVRSTAAFGATGVLEAISFDGGDQAYRIDVGQDASQINGCPGSIGEGPHFTPIDEDLPGDFEVLLNQTTKITNAKKTGARKTGTKKSAMPKVAVATYDDLPRPIRKTIEEAKTCVDLERKKLAELPDNLFDHCRSDGILSVELGENLLTAIPSSIGRLAKLNRLDVNSNRLQSLPNELARLPLETLWLEFNPNLRDLDVVWSLKRLQELDLRGCGITTLVAQVAQLSRLTKLLLDDNPLEHLDEQLYGLSRLKTLSISHCRLTKISGRLSELVDLERLDLGGNAISTLPDLSPLKNLKTLSLSDNPLGIFPPGILELTNLQKLTISNCGLKALPTEIGRLTQLTVLEADHNQLTVLPDSIGKLANLERLCLKKNNLAALPRTVGKLTRLGCPDDLLLDGNPLPGWTPDWRSLRAVDHLQRILATQAKQTVIDGTSLLNGKLSRTGPRRDTAELLSMAEIAALSDDTLIVYGIELAEVDVHRPSFERQKACAAAVMNQLKKRDAWQGIRQIVRTQLACHSEVRDFDFPGTVAIKTQDHPMADFLLTEYLFQAKAGRPPTTSAAIADLAKMLGRELPIKSQ